MIKAILLAAGQSKRMKSENKLIKLYKNKPLINYSLNVLKKSKVNKIIIVLGHQRKEVKKIIKKNKKIIFTYNKNYKKGMASSIKIGLKKISKNDKGFIIAQSDMPFVKQSDINKVPTKTDNVLVTNGGKQAIYNLFQVVLNPGDEVLIPTPYWLSYPEITLLAGAKPIKIKSSTKDSAAPANKAF